MAVPFTPVEIDAIRANTPGCTDDLIHLNHAGSSLPDVSVLDAQIGHLRREAGIGGYEAAEETAEAEAAVYDSIAAMIGGRRHEVARMEHATAAWNAAFWAIPKRPWQRIITHDHDYGANWVAFLRAVEVHGVVIERIPSDAHGQIDLERLASALERPDDIALVSLAWIPTNGGLVNPAAGVGALTRAAGVPFLLDACQAVGQLDIDVESIGCDALSATGRKYLRGPRGSGFLFVHSRAVERFAPAHPDHHGAEWSAIDSYTFAPGATRYEYWEHNHAAWPGLGAAVDVALRLGVDRIQATIAQRAKELREQLVERGMSVHDAGVAKCGIVTMTHPTLDAGEVVSRLATRGVNASSTFLGSARADMEARGLPSLVRLSVHCTTTPAEIQRAATAIGEI
ncbi:MAG: aminotransferase class V-fold PLP-dependent enzyme [Ilumatobacter sp.]|uniref:aminotransferase class V-fold PLP-dependent enzyme n=1 Tax=Ilumatobacter sp. TaxID=1967498 RepID=UPI0032988671